MINHDHFHIYVCKHAKIKLNVYLWLYCLNCFRGWGEIGFRSWS